MNLKALRMAVLLWGVWCAFGQSANQIATAVPWRFVFVGDMHTPQTAVPSEIATAVVNDRPKLLLVAGDIVVGSARATTNEFANQLIAWREAMAPVYAAGIPVYVVRGNHEDLVTNGLPVWNNFFSSSNAMPGNGPDGERNLTYSFTCSNALFIALDNYINIHRVNQSWLDQQLAENVRPHLFVFGHEPAFKAIHPDCLDDYPAGRNLFWNSLAHAGAKVYLCAHDHFFNLARIDNGDGHSTNDLYQYILGTGGSTNWPVKPAIYNGTNAPFTPINVCSISNTWGYLLVEISGPGTNDLGVTMTWKQRAYDTNTASYAYVATTNVLAYTAFNPYADTVGDGIPDGWRRYYFGDSATNSSSCAACDPDHDGMSNAREYLAGTNPTNAVSRFVIQGITTGSNVTISFQSSPNRIYTLYYKTNLGDSAWMNVPSQTAIPGIGRVDRLTDPLPSGGQRFYRVGVRLP